MKLKIEIFGAGCHKCSTIERLVQEKIDELGIIEADVINSRDTFEMVGRGVMFAPALFVNGRKKSEGRVPAPEEIKKWIEEAKK